MTKKAKPKVHRTDDGVSLPFVAWRFADMRLAEMIRQVGPAQARPSRTFTIKSWPHGHHRHVHVYGDES